MIRVGEVVKREGTRKEEKRILSLYLNTWVLVSNALGMVRRSECGRRTNTVATENLLRPSYRPHKARDSTPFSEEPDYIVSR